MEALSGERQTDIKEIFLKHKNKEKRRKTPSENILACSSDLSSDESRQSRNSEKTMPRGKAMKQSVRNSCTLLRDYF